MRIFGTLLFLLSLSFSAIAADLPNFVFILADDLGWAETSVPMHPTDKRAVDGFVETPNLMRLAEEGMRFSNGYASAPLCTPTRRSVLCGMTPARQRGTEFKSDNFDPAEHLTIPKALKKVDESYQCAHFGKWGELMVASPEQAGYDVSDGETGNKTGGARIDTELYAVKEDPKLTFSLAERTNAFMEQQVKAKKPFFVQVSLYAAHMQIQMRAKTLEKYKKKGDPTRAYPLSFAAMVDDLDAGVGIILDKINELNITGNTYVIFSADNGGSPFARDNALFNKQLRMPGFTKNVESGVWKNSCGFKSTPGRLPENYPLRGSKQWLFEGGLRVPFIVRGPKVKPESWCNQPVVLYDLLPTLVDIAATAKVGKKADALENKVLNKEIDGGSFYPQLLGKDEPVKRQLPGVLFHRPNHGQRASVLRVGSKRLIVTWDPKTQQVAKKELYNLKEDVGEWKDIADNNPEEVERMFKLLNDYLTEVNAEKAEFIKRKKKPKK